MICLVTWPTAHHGLLQLIPSSPEEAPIQADSNANHAHAPTEYSGKTAPHSQKLALILFFQVVLPRAVRKGIGMCDTVIWPIFSLNGSLKIFVAIHHISIQLICKELIG